MEKIDVIGYLQDPEFLTRRLTGRSRFKTDELVTYNKASTDKKNLEVNLFSEKSLTKNDCSAKTKKSTLLCISDTNPELWLASNGNFTKLFYFIYYILLSFVL